jgi:drug/metabolite transporter (DMT)-like permease
MRWAYFSLGCAVLVWGTVLPISRLVTVELPVLTATALRLSVGALVFAPVLWKRRREWLSLSFRDLALVALIGLSLVAASSLMLCSTSLLPCATVCLLTALTPAVTFAGAVLFLRDRIDGRQLTWIILAAGAAVALAMLIRERYQLPESALLIAAGLASVLAAILCEAAGTLLSKAAVARVSPLTLAALATTVAALAVLPAACLLGEGCAWASVSSVGWLAAIWWGAGGLALGTWLWYSGVQRASGTTAAAFLAALPLVSFGVSWLLGCAGSA